MTVSKSLKHVFGAMALAATVGIAGGALAQSTDIPDMVKNGDAYPLCSNEDKLVSAEGYKVTGEGIIPQKEGMKGDYKAELMTDEENAYLFVIRDEKGLGCAWSHGLQWHDKDGVLFDTSKKLEEFSPTEQRIIKEAKTAIPGSLYANTLFNFLQSEKTMKVYGAGFDSYGNFVALMAQPGMMTQKHWTLVEERGIEWPKLKDGKEDTAEKPMIASFSVNGKNWQKVAPKP